MDELTTLTTATITAAVVSAAKSAKGLLTGLLGPTADAYGQILASEVQLRLLENQIKNFKKVKNICDENNIGIKQIDLKVLFPYLNGVALEENETLQDMWANLFVNYIDASKNLNVTVYPAILSQISSQDAEVAMYMSKQADGRIIIEISNDREILNLSVKLMESLPNLVRLGIAIQTLPTDGRLVISANNEISKPIHSGGYYELTNFGWDFLRACSR